MRLTAIALLTTLLLGFGSAAEAGEPVAGIVFDNPSLAGGGTGTGRGDYIEGWNVDYPDLLGPVYGAQCFGLPYEPGQTYWLDRIEFVVGGVAGTAMIEVRADNGTGLPTGPVLAGGTFEHGTPIIWQGADFRPCVLVEEGLTYWIVYHPVPDSHTSFSDGFDVLIAHLWSEDCVTWPGPGDGYPWKAKFFGTYQPSAADEATWTAIKTLYR